MRLPANTPFGLLCALTGLCFSSAYGHGHEGGGRGRRAPEFVPTVTPQDVAAALSRCKLELSSANVLLNSSDAGFQDAVGRFAANVAYSQATVAALPANSKDVAEIISCISSQKIPYAVLAGGHKFDAPGKYPPGLVLSLRALNKTSYDSQTQRVTVGPGARWGDVYSSMQTATGGTRFPLGGRVSDVGVGGLLLGGGDSWLTGAAGFATDQIVSMQVVTAQGQVVTASASSHPDLFFGLRGTLNQLGVVTSFELNTLPVSPTQWSGFWLYSANDIAGVSSAMDTMTASDTGTSANAIVSFVALDNTVFILANPWFNGTAAAANSSGAFAGFDKLVSVPMLPPPAEKNYVQVNQEQDANIPPGRYIMDTLTVASLPAAFLEQALSTYTSFLATYPQVNNGSAVLFEPVRKTAFDVISNAKAAWPPQPYTFGAIVGIQLTWTDTSFDSQAAAAATQLRKQLSALAHTAGIDVGGDGKPLGAYPNYASVADLGPQDLYQTNLPALEALKAQWDPSCLFYQGFALGSACASVSSR